MAGPKIRKKLKKKEGALPPIATLLKSVVGISGLGNAALQGFKKLIKQGYSEKEAIKMLRNPTKGND
jgi:hypothetical protein